jgi:cytochrome P450 family 4
MFTIGSAEGAEVPLAKLRLFPSSFFQNIICNYLFLFILKVVLSSNKIIDKGREYDFIQAWLATGLLTSTGIHRRKFKLPSMNEQISYFYLHWVSRNIEGSKWHKRRKMLTPTFHFKILEEFIHVFNEQSAVLVEKLNEKVGHEFDIFPFITRCTLDVICGKYSLSL